MATFRTTPPPTYLPPTREEMQAMASKVGVRRFAPDFVGDLVNLMAGGSFNPPSSYHDAVEVVVRESSLQPNGTDRNKRPYWNMPSGNSTYDREEAVRAETDKRMRYHQSVCDFLQAVDMDGLPGGSPLEKAMSLLKLLATQKGGETGGSGGSDDTLPIFVDNDKAEGVAAKLNEAVDTVESLSDDEKELLSDEGSDAGKGGKKEEDPTQARKLAEDMLKGKEIMVELSRHLDKLSRMQVRRQRKVEPDPEGDEVRWRPMKHLGEIGRIPQSEWALPRTFRMYRHVTGQTSVRERCTRIERKQLLYLIIDCSGSMGSGQRIYKAGGILMNRLKAVIEGEAELYVRLFDTSLKQEHHAGTPEEARALMKYFTERNFSGGGTDIPGCVKAAQKRIVEIIASGATYRPELCVITDGDDDTKSLSLKDIPETKLHSFMVECGNPHLAELARRSGGVGVEAM